MGQPISTGLKHSPSLYLQCLSLRRYVTCASESTLLWYCYQYERLELWKSQAMTRNDYCYGNHRLLLWKSQTIAMETTNYCYGNHILLLWKPQTIAMETTDYCYGNYTLTLWKLHTIDMETNCCKTLIETAN
jgi:hypothetical protein